VDTGSGVASWQLQVEADGSSEWADACPAQSAPTSGDEFQCTVDGAELAEGAAQLRALVTDKAGNTYTTAASGTTVDDVPPSGTLERPSEASYVRGALELQGTGEDPISGVATWTAQIAPAGSGSWSSACAPQSTPVSGSTYQCSLATTSFADGEYELRVQIVDNAGNSYTTATQSIAIDNTPPVGSLDALERDSSGEITVHGPATDAGSGIASWQLQVSANGSGSWRNACLAQDLPTEGSNYACEIDTEELTNGRYQFRAEIADYAGNLYTTPAISTIVENAGSGAPPCTDTWIGSADDGLWQTGENWSTGDVPSSSDRACIPEGATVDVTSGTHEVGSIESAGELVIAGGTLELADGAETSDARSLTESSGDLAGPAVLELADSLAWTGGTMSGSGATVVEPDATASVSNAVLAERELINEGVLTLDGAISPEWSGHATLINTGELKKTSGEAIIQTVFDNEGTVNVSEGTLELDGGGAAAVHPGTWSAAAGARIVFTNADYPLGASATFNGVISITNGARVKAQQIDAADAELTVAPNGSYEERTTVLELEGPATSTIATLNLAGARGWEIIDTAALEGAGHVDVTEAFSGGNFAYMGGSGTTTLEPDAIATVPGYLGLEEEHVLENKGTLTIGEAANVSGGTASGFINTGTLRKTEGEEPATISAAFANEGAVDVTSGKLELTGGGAVGEHGGGSWTATGAGAGIVFSSTSTFDLGSSVSMSGAIEIVNGTVAAGTISGADANVTAVDSRYPGTLQLDGGSASTLGELTLNQGVLAGSGDLDIADAFTGYNNASLEGTGTILIETGATGSVSSTVSLKERTLENAGTLGVGSLGRIQGSAHARIVNSGALTITSERVSTNYGIEITPGILAVPDEATLLNTGTVLKTGENVPTRISFAVENDGAIESNSGKLELGGGGLSGELAFDSWKATTGAEIELNGSGEGIEYSLGAAASMVGSIRFNSNVTAGTIEGSGAALTTEYSDVSLTGLAPSELGSLTFLQAPPDVWWPQFQTVSVASELHIVHSLIWASYNASFAGPGALVTDPGSTTEFHAGNVKLEGGQFINEGTATWEMGSITDEVDDGTFFVNLGTFHTDAVTEEPLIRGCKREGEGYACPVFENYGTFTASFPHSGVGSPHIDWQVDLANYGELESPYWAEPDCGPSEPWEEAGSPHELCERAIRAYEGLLLREGASVTNVTWPVIEGIAEEGQTLKVGVGTWPSGLHPGFSYQWELCGGNGEEEVEGGECEEVEGATASTLPVDEEDVGATIRVVATAAIRARAESRTSAPTAEVAGIEEYEELEGEGEFEGEVGEEEGEEEPPAGLYSEGPEYLEEGTYGGTPDFTGDIDRRADVTFEFDESPFGKGMSPDLSSSPRGGQWRCHGFYDTVANEASGVAVGNCKGGSVLNSTKLSVPNEQGISFAGGYVAGSYNACGWLEAQNVSSKDATSYSGCSNPNVGYGKFGAVFNSKEAEDGTPIDVATKTCSAYANFRPFSKDWGPTNKVTSSLPIGLQLRWRYVAGLASTKGYEKADGDFWVMVRDTKPRTARGVSWVFVPYHGCFGSDPRLPAGKGGYWHP
jgi:hypothetical protein